MQGLNKRMKLYAITHDILGDVFWDVFRNGLFAAAARYDVDVEHLRPGSYSPEIMAGQLEAAARSRPAGIITTIPDVAVVEGPIRQAIAAGVPVIAVNTRDPRPPPERIPYLLYIGGDDVIAGDLAGRYVIDQRRPHATMCVDHYLHEQVCHHDRWTGFKRAMDAAQISAERLRVPGEDPAASARAVAEYLRDHPECSAVLTLGPPGAQAVLDAGARHVAHMTFDVATLQIEGIRSDRIIATIDSQQYLQGYLSVEAMWLHVAQGLTIASDILTGPTIIDKAGIERAAEGVANGWR